MFIKEYKFGIIRIAALAVIVAITISNAMPVLARAPYTITDPAGILDTTFDSDGLVTTVVGVYGDEGRAVVVQPDGKIIVAGTASMSLGAGSNRDFALIRYNENGSLDTSFDLDGKVTTDFGAYQDYAEAVAIQPDGKIIVAGYRQPASGSDLDWALARYNSDGSLDTSFDGDGKITTNLGSGSDFLFAIAIQPDGKIIAVGSKNIGINNADVAIIRYNTDGSLDTAFDTDGIAITAVSSGGDNAMSVAIQPDDKIVVGGTIQGPAGNNSDFALIRYNSNGSLDTSFGTDGIVTTDFGIGTRFERGGQVTLQSDGKIIIAGTTDEYFLLARYNSNGSLDTSFGTDGLVATYSGGGSEYVQDVVLQGNGKIILAGHTFHGFGTSSYDFAIVRYNSNGSLDTTFDTDGIVTTDFGNIGSIQEDLANSVAIQSDGNIVVAGYAYIGGDYDGSYQVAVARYIGDEPPHTLYVKWDATGFNDGTSWTNAYTDLQSALTAASSGDEIWVAQGTYKPTTGSDRNATFQLENGVAVYGGFAGTETTLNQRDPSTNVTILGGDIGTPEDNSDNSYHVITGSGTDNTAILDGFTVTGGNANGSYPFGGGMYNDGGSPTLTNVTFSGNAAAIGGGMYNYSSSSPMLTNVTFSGNAAEGGGGMYNNNSSPTLTNVTFSGNTASYYGGGMDNYQSSPTLTNVTFSGNVAEGGGVGGGMYNFTNSSPTLTNVTFSDNSASLGGGMYNSDNSSPTLMNVTFNNNSATYSWIGAGGGMYNSSSSPTLADVTFSGNSASLGGGMYNADNSNLILNNVTFSSNSAIDYGGGMHNVNSHPILTNTTFSGNSASDGGGMYNSWSSLTLTNVIFSNNSATNYGGGMFNNDSSNPALLNVTFDSNSAARGGGMANNFSSSPSLTNVTFSGNQATTWGGGLYNTSNSNPTLTNVTFNMNSTANSGGGIYNKNSSPTLTSVTFSGNSATNYGGGIYNHESNPTIRNTILWSNTAPTGSQVSNFSSTPVMSYSVVQDGCPSGSTCTNIIATNPLLGTFGNYGSSTQTIPLLPGSSAIDAGDDANCPSTDQRGVTRPQGSHCDIGAYEVNPPGAATLTSPTGDIGTNYTPAYTWNEVFGATWYYLWINGPSGNVIKQWYQASAVCSDGICSVTPSKSLGGGVHTWWIQTYNSAGYGAWSSGMSFSTTIPTAPGAATLISPSGEIGSNYNPTYTWNEVFGATWYYLWVNGPSGNVIQQWYQASAVCSGGTCSVTPATNLRAGSYTFWVQTYNSVGYGPWSSGMSFTVSLPAATTLVSPSGSIGTSTPTYTWNAVSGVTWYYLWVNGPSGNVIKQWHDASVICSGGTCSITPSTTLASGAHTFWVQTWNSAGYGPWSTGMNFTFSPEK